MQQLTCKELIEFLDDYLSGDISSEMNEKFEAHLKICRACRDYLHTYCETIALARSSAEAAHFSQSEEVPQEILTVVASILRNRPSDR